MSLYSCFKVFVSSGGLTLTNYILSIDGTMAHGSSFNFRNPCENSQVTKWRLIQLIKNIEEKGEEKRRAGRGGGEGRWGRR